DQTRASNEGWGRSGIVLGPPALPLRLGPYTLHLLIVCRHLPIEVLLHPLPEVGRDRLVARGQELHVHPGSAVEALPNETAAVAPVACKCIALLALQGLPAWTTHVLGDRFHVSALCAAGGALNLRHAQIALSGSRVKPSETRANTSSILPERPRFSMSLSSSRSYRASASSRWARSASASASLAASSSCSLSPSITLNAATNCSSIGSSSSYDDSSTLGATPRRLIASVLTAKSSPLAAASSA